MFTKAHHDAAKHVHPRTGLLRIARSDTDLAVILEAFKTGVVEQKQELLAQAEELVLAPDLRTLTSSLSRRVAFWEDQIEESWHQWSTQSSLFHEAQAEAADSWEKLRAQSYSLLEAAEALMADSSGGLGEQVPDPFDAELHDTFAEVATVLALLGSWAHFHNLRGDGHVLVEMRDLFRSIVLRLDAHFVPLGYEGSSAVRQRLDLENSWRMVEDSPAELPRNGGCPVHGRGRVLFKD
ncbi:unnamed protein product [Symbiodinium natans]|uniref:Uncharacterized protein n=1 Tax=Symbiodinium natans TaxID=878477 RepID=A0A812N9F4_9DINO|nr:unnamed protein product [Symbiodinium natans]